MIFVEFAVVLITHRRGPPKFLLHETEPGAGMRAVAVFRVV